MINKRENISVGVEMRSALAGSSSVVESMAGGGDKVLVKEGLMFALPPSACSCTRYCIVPDSLPVVSKSRALAD